jgi:hypothetical protein
MSTNLRVVTFGIVSGLIWTLILFHPNTSPSAWSSGRTVALTFYAVGIATGVAVSFALKVPLARCGLWCCLGLGFLALPFGAFIFELLFNFYFTIHLSIENLGAFHPVAPFVLGFYGALWSVTAMYYLFPAAILTTFLLRVVIRRGQKKEDAA